VCEVAAVTTPPLAICTPDSDPETTAILLLIAATYILLVALVLLRRPRSLGFTVTFVMAASLGPLLTLGALAKGVPFLLSVLGALVVVPFVVSVGAKRARSSGHPSPTLRASAAGVLGVCFLAVAASIAFGLAFSTGSTCIGWK
jgi:hypothetical protein